jgi:hypothetical protein
MAWPCQASRHGACFQELALYSLAEEAKEHRHIICPLRVPVIEMRRLERTDIVRFAIIVPGDELQESGSQS